jgi:hypothetical protein
MTDLQKAAERLEKFAANLFAKLDDLLMGYDDDECKLTMTRNGVTAEELDDATILCSCGRSYRKISNWEKHVDSQHAGKV